jgi:hypothetical protein
MERKSIRISAWSITGLLMLGVCAPSARAQASLMKIDAPQGGKIVYGKVDGATSQADALVSVLHSVHKSSGEKPLIGRSFRLRYTDSVAVFFTVVDRSHDNKPVAGLLIAATTGPKQVEAALLTDDTSRFGKTVNPMLKLLSDNWHPSGLKADADPTWCGSAFRAYPRPSDLKTNMDAETEAAKRWADELAFAPQNDAPADPPLALHSIRTSDGTARVSVPDGWKLRPDSDSGALVITGPVGESAGFNLVRQAIDPASPEQQLPSTDAVSKTSDQLVYPANADIAKAFPDLFQQWRRLNGLDPTDLVIDRAEKLPTPQGDRCVHVTGQVNPDGKGMQEMNTVLCATDAVRGKYLVLLFHTLLPLAVADRERATMSAILASFRIETPGYQGPDVKPPGYEAKRYYMQEKLGLYGVIEQEFNSSRAVIAAQGCHPSDPWGLNPYLLDQSAIEDNAKGGHGAAWNSTVDALVKSDPSRFEYVDTPNFWQGADY